MMGKLIWHELSRYVSLTASTYAVWAGIWAIFFRKFFWDFVGGILRDPGGIQPNPRISIFITLIVRVPVIQTLTIAFGLAIIALEWPLVSVKWIPFHRVVAVKMLLLVIQAALSALLYQGTNAALWSLVGVGLYGRALASKEIMSTERKQGAGHP